MRRPVARNRPSAVGRSLPAPTGGWDAVSPISAMPLDRARVLDNWVPRADCVEIRRGFVSQAVGSPSPVEALLAFRGSALGDKLFACTGGEIFDVSTKGASYVSPVYTGATSNRWNALNFANPAGEWLLAYNGVDTPAAYNGTSWSAMTSTGSSGPITLDPKKLFTAALHKGRIFALELGSLHCWFPAAAAFQGAHQLLDLGSVFSKGGHLVAVGSWGYPGQTPDSFVSFMTDQGQVAVYQGIDPSDASNWSIVGVFNVGKPLGPKALVEYGSDLMVLTTDGIVAMSQVLQADRTQTALKAITGTIAPAFAKAVRAYKANFGWEGIFYPGDTTSTNADANGGGLALFNIPTDELVASMQFVQNTITGAWCRFPTGIAANCWQLANDAIYFGGANGVYQWDVGASDDGEPIVYDVGTAYTSFGSPNLKVFSSARPLLNTVSIVQPTLGLNVNYQDSEPTSQPVIVEPSSDTPNISYQWLGVTGEGVTASLRMQINILGDAGQQLLGIDNLGDALLEDGSGNILAISDGTPFDVPCQLFGFDLMYQNGNLLG